MQHSSLLEPQQTILAIPSVSSLIETISYMGRCPEPPTSTLDSARDTAVPDILSLLDCLDMDVFSDGVEAQNPQAHAAYREDGKIDDSDD